MNERPHPSVNALSSWWFAIVFFGPLLALAAMKWMSSLNMDVDAVWTGILVLTLIGIVLSSLRLAKAIGAERALKKRVQSSNVNGWLVLGLVLGGMALSGAIFFGGCLLVVFSEG